MSGSESPRNDSIWVLLGGRDYDGSTYFADLNVGKLHVNRVGRRSYRAHVSLCGGRPRNSRQSSYVHQTRSSHPAAVLPSLPPPWFDRPYVVTHIRRHTAVGSCDQRTRSEPNHATLVHRQEDRDPRIQSGQVAERQRDHNHRPMGRERRTAWQSSRHATSAQVSEYERMAYRRP